MDLEKGIIRSIIDTDFYKLTMQNAVCKLFPRANVRYEFFNRGKTKFKKGFDKRLRKEIEKMALLKLTIEEKNFLRKRCGRFIDDVYLDFLSSYQFDPSEVGIILDDNGDLKIVIEGPWYKTILWEVPLMALVSELYFQDSDFTTMDRHAREKNNLEKGMFFYGHNMKVTDFGTRRRFSYENQFEVCKDMKSTFGSDKFFMGTSNPHIAMELDILPIGTHAHEWFMFMAARYGYKMANRKALEHWSDVYNGDLGTALTDTYTTDAFLKSFDKKFSKLYDGARHDSNDPLAWTDKLVKHYKQMGIVPSTKTLVYSNALTKDSAYEIHNHCINNGEGIGHSFGIGTFFSNDVGIKTLEGAEVKPLNIVIKMTSAQANPDDNEWIDTVKLSDDLGKNTGKNEAVDLAKQTLGLK